MPQARFETATYAWDRADTGIGDFEFVVQLSLWNN
jgi:hypothetical protein